MGKSNLFTAEQRYVFDQVSKNDFLRAHFYFTGGTALSYYYLQHRYSEDMDFFSIKKFIPEEILAIVSEWSKNIHLRLSRSGMRLYMFLPSVFQTAKF